MCLSVHAFVQVCRVIVLCCNLYLELCSFIVSGYWLVLIYMFLSTYTLFFFTFEGNSSTCIIHPVEHRCRLNGFNLFVVLKLISCCAGANSSFCCIALYICLFFFILFNLWLFRKVLKLRCGGDIIFCFTWFSVFCFNLKFCAQRESLGVKVTWPNG